MSHNHNFEFDPKLAARRKFLRHTALALSGAAVGIPALKAAAECNITEQEILGPMYNFGAPVFQLKLAEDGEPGQRLILRGAVLSSDCKTPLPNTLIEIWHADDKGMYDKAQPGNFLENVKPHLRGMILTDAKGRYEIETIVPGAYPIPPGVPGLEKYGNLTRARHIHIKVEPFLHTALTTQLYFKGDEHLAGDPWGGHKPALALNMKQDGKFMKADFDFVLGTGLKG
jgi:catechol 1,2-dioxygenase